MVASAWSALPEFIQQAIFQLCQGYVESNRGERQSDTNQDTDTV
jgi:hypothetical protein